LAAWFRDGVTVVGVEPESTPVDSPEGWIAADSLAPKQVGQLMFSIAQRFVRRVILVTDVEIRAAQEALWRAMRVLAEPGGATAFAALLSGKYERRGRMNEWAC
jgi:threonine dehydratase